MDIRIAGTVNDSIVDGPGLRYTVFVQGCPHHCPGCHNPETHDPQGGHIADTDDLVKAFRKNPLLSGITLSGGEPMEQPEPCIKLAQAAHALDMSVWCYTGYTFEQLFLFGLKDDQTIGDFTKKKTLLHHCDVLVDGPFIQEQRSLDLLYRGSRNQRLIDIRESIRLGYVVTWNPHQ